jgi:flagellar export protein FliJ
MKKFQFALETVRKVRKAQEQEALLALSQARQKMQAEIQAKNSLVFGLSAALMRREELAKNNATSASAFELEHLFIEGQKTRITHAELRINRAQRGVDQAMRKLTEARKKTEMMEKLREKALSDYRVQRNRYERVQADDLNVMRARMSKITHEEAAG